MARKAKKDNSIYSFWRDKATRENVKAYFIQFFKDKAVEKLMNREDAVALADATDMLNEAFEAMDIMFEPKPRVKNNINEAR